MLRATASAVIALLLAVPAGSSCVGLQAPVAGPLVAAFAPDGRYAGHWGVDFGIEAGSEVRSASSGVVTYAGVVNGNSTVSVDHGDGLKTSYSFLSERAVTRGTWLPRGRVIGTSGEHGGRPALHFSVRRDGVYVDPEDYLGCLPASPNAGLRLVPVPEPDD